MFDRILIANRGEIACRIIKTARRLGIKTVAVYSDADANARHVRLADEAVHIGPAPARESYLLADRLIAAAKKTGAQAIHPGYGFLSENVEFAETCAREGIVFVGPPASAISAMGLKDAAKKLMEAANVPVVPGYHGDNQDDDFLRGEAAKIGYPVLIKAVAGGGGKGMRRVDDAAEFDASLASARREAKAAFGNDACLIEKYITKPRHIEIQVFADKHGNVVHLFERDCSLQRRHQKVVEEAPAPHMPDYLRAAMGAAAVTAAAAIGYEGAGTIEFIVDVANGIEDAPFYFMEMNTRLQVEHPVTEMITGQDLVEWQLRVAAGEVLPLAQEQLAICGHALEVRIYAEDPARGFLPSIGRLLHLGFPTTDSHVRVDTGVEQGDEVSMHYDPMIAKLIVWDRDRASAVRRMKGALGQCAIAGLASNVAFLGRVAGNADFIAGDVDTGFIDRHLEDLVPTDSGASDRVLALAAVDHLLRLREQYTATARASGDPYNPWGAADGWRMNGQTDLTLRFDDGHSIREILVSFDGDGWCFDFGGHSMKVRALRGQDGELRADLGGETLRAIVVRAGHDVSVIIGGVTRRVQYYDPGVAAEEGTSTGGGITAPMPGKVTRVMVAAGDSVTRGTPLLILEAMKMEHTMTAPVDGTVAALHVGEGDQVTEGSVLAVVEAAEA
ncbi:acetyl/propionyl/methylcrotonyl-CoA carboxylase subunit alpha [Govanella unica]|uniref:Acetyl/propionyl/methylcrotonyl-CoA carboxylase subunit alpha n=1 Tax=Govanella unica TaxID=2975056 RepID=A0A9X3Z648_9PROT|nr:acetyl/propionyl/methylcrotonyl-CoA carboxylase subunit alpha [Govania unica]MDA5192574.1 acetyl/propionyl/methylcrotonyl-CoA carboxylase subunit alpha [Govania unica]